MNFSIVVFSHSEDDFVKAKSRLECHGITKENIHFCNSKITTRLAFIKKQPNRWLLFLDSDCEISPETVVVLKSHAEKKQTEKIFVGIYSNPQWASYLQKVHNFIANTWLQSSYEFTTQKRKLLGGAFFIFVDQEKLKNTNEPEQLFWGAEDKFLSQQLLKISYDLRCEPKFKVTHYTSKKLNHFIRRAWLQGYNDHFVVNSDAKEKLEINYWLSELAKTNLWLTPAVLVHFLILQSGKLFQKVRPQRNKA